MVIYAFIPPNIHASYYYRLITPLQAMEELKLPVEVLIDDTTQYVDVERRAAGLVWSDVVWLYQATDSMMRFNINNVNRMKGHKDKNGKLWYPTNFVVDTDDDLYNISPWNWAYRDLGTRYPDGTPLQIGGQVEMETATGERTILWKDGRDGFDIRRNITKLEDFRSLCQCAGAMTCSTPRTEKYVRREMGTGVKTFVNFNGVKFDHYLNVKLAPHKGVRVLWQGSNTHYEDLYFITDALARVMKKYPEMTLVFWGEQFGDIIGKLPAEQIEFIPWMNLDKYHLRLVTVGHDISLAPLRPTVFNESRSAIKWYEASALVDPAATIAQRAGAYQDEIEHGKTGLLFDTPEEFEQQLCMLIEDVKLRRELAANAKDWVHDNRDVLKLAPKLYEYFEQVRATKRETCEVEEETNAPVPAEQPDIPTGEAEGSKSS